jgi:CSLREA domain-containing protein
MRLPRFNTPRPRRSLFTLALGVAVCGALAAAVWGRLAPAANAASVFVVNTTADTYDADTSDGVCDDGTGKCSLRAAIFQAAANAGPDVINFQIGTGPQTITLTTNLPAVTESLTIDATTQPGYAGSPVVTLNGNGLLVDGLFFTGGGPSTVRGLVVNGFGGTAVLFSGGASGSVVEGCYLGTNAAGTSAIGNSAGVVVVGNGATVGGTTAAARNVISGNGTGVVIFGDNTSVRGNYIGVAADGSTPLPNTGDGVAIRPGVTSLGTVVTDAQDNSIGGTSAGQANVIAHNGGNGIYVFGQTNAANAFNRGNTFRGNSLYSNGLQGVGLERPGGGLEANDAADADDGPNGLQNYPLVTSYAPSGGGTNVQGTLDSQPNKTYAVDFYASAACDGSGQGEGQALLGTSNVTTDAAGHAAFNASLPAVPTGLPVLTATATDPSGNTSEFSPCLDPSTTPTVQFKRALYEGAEAGPDKITVTVTRTYGAASSAASVDYSTADGVAKAGLDYAATSGTLNFAPGELTKSFDVQLLDDLTDEDTQAFDLVLSNPAGGVALGGNSTAAVQILDNDRRPSVEPGPSLLLAEGNTGTTQALLIVKLSRASEKSFTATYATRDGYATAPADYVAASGQLTFAPGETTKTVSVAVNGDTVIEPQEHFSLRVDWMTDDGRGSNVTTFVTIFDDDGAPGVHFADAKYTVAETAGHADISVVRRGDTSAAAAYTYEAEVGVTASDRNDFTPTRGRLDFAPGETEKTFPLLVNDDAFVEGDEEVSVVIRSAANSSEGEAAHVVITSDDDAPPTAANNPLDDSAHFVRQHYHDFLGREPDAEGFAFWKGQLDACGADAECLRVTRASVSQAFFLSIEFQRTGYLVYRVHTATYPEGPGWNHDLNGRIYQIAPLYVLFPNMQTIRRGVFVGQTGWEQKLRDNTLDFARGWVESAEFKVQQPADMTADAYVDKLFANAGVTPAPEERAAALTAFGAGGTEGRAAALLSVADSRSVYNRQYNAAFVAMEYYGYLRRSPRDAPDFNFDGYDFWLAKLDSFSAPGEDVRDDAVAARRAARAEMARAFVESAEYRGRFGTP